MSCRALNKQGEPCQALVVDGDLCPTHADPAAHRARCVAAGKASAARKRGSAALISADEIRQIVTEDDCMAALDDARQWLLAGRIATNTSREYTANVKTRLIAMQQNRTRKLEDELQKRLDENELKLDAARKENETLRSQLGLRSGKVKVVP
jgi:hypothetical protein